MNHAQDGYVCLVLHKSENRSRRDRYVPGRSECRGAEITQRMPNETNRRKARVFLVDDHALVREHLTALIQGEVDLEVCGEAADLPTALALIRQQSPDLVILDIFLKRSNGLDLLKELPAVLPKPAVLVLSMHDERLYAERALQAGAQGYITKEDATINILPAIRRVLGRQVYLSDRIGGLLTGKQASAEATTGEEVQV
jgi:DNA-binding NarL/FixJ family response regulator